MPFYRKPKTFTPLLMAAEKKAIKNGQHHSIFTSRFDRYVGHWKNDLKEGKGLFLTIKGKLYEGDWYQGFRHGFGTLSHKLENGTFYLEYRGEWVRGKPHGIGWWYYENGDVYFGFWDKGHRHGYGKMWYNNRTYYVGYWKCDKKHGIGMFVKVVKGETGTYRQLAEGMKHGRNHKKHSRSPPSQGPRLYGAALALIVLPCTVGFGDGLLEFVLRTKDNSQNGDRYEGNWKNDIKNGLGRFYHIHTGQLQEGCWVNNFCVRSKMSDIIIRQFADLPTPYPITNVELQNARIILEQSALWLKQKMGEFDKNLNNCIEKM